MEPQNSKKAMGFTNRPFTSSQDRPNAPSPPGSSAVSMHTLPEYHDSNEEDFATDDLPAYTDVEHEAGSTTRQNAAAGFTHGEVYLAQVYHHVPGSRPVRYRTHRFNNPFKPTRGTAEKCFSVTFSPELSSSANDLNALVLQEARRPPEPYIHIKGTHTRSTRDSQGKESKETVVDFDFRVEARETITHGEHENLFPEPNLPPHQQPCWRKISLPGLEKKAYRGTRIKCRAAPFKGASSSSYSPTVPGLSDPSDLQSALEYWSSRFTTDSSTFKSFTFERLLHGFDNHRVSQAVTSHIRSLNYRGSVTVETHVNNAGFIVYSDHWINRLRIITWPVIWAMEKRYEVVKVRWFFSKSSRPTETGTTLRALAKEYDEEGWVRLWGKAIKRAAEGRRRNGEFVTLQDLELAQQPDAISSEEAVRRERMQSGQGNWMDSAVGLVRGLGEVNREYNRAAGWGGDE